MWEYFAKKLVPMKWSNRAKKSLLERKYDPCPWCGGSRALTLLVAHGQYKLVKTDAGPALKWYGKTPNRDVDLPKLPETSPPPPRRVASTSVRVGTTRAGWMEGSIVESFEGREGGSGPFVKIIDNLEVHNYNAGLEAEWEARKELDQILIEEGFARAAHRFHYGGGLE